MSPAVSPGLSPGGMSESRGDTGRGQLQRPSLLARFSTEATFLRKLRVLTGRPLFRIALCCWDRGRLTHFALTANPGAVRSFPDGARGRRKAKCIKIPQPRGVRDLKWGSKWGRGGLGLYRIMSSPKSQVLRPFRTWERPKLPAPRSLGTSESGFLGFWVVERLEPKWVFCQRPESPGQPGSWALDGAAGGDCERAWPRPQSFVSALTCFHLPQSEVPFNHLKTYRKTLLTQGPSPQNKMRPHLGSGYGRGSRTALASANMTLTACGGRL